MAQYDKEYASEMKQAFEGSPTLRRSYETELQGSTILREMLTLSLKRVVRKPFSYSTFSDIVRICIGGGRSSWDTRIKSRLKAMRNLGVSENQISSFESKQKTFIDKYDSDLSHIGNALLAYIRKGKSIKRDKFFASFLDKTRRLITYLSKVDVSELPKTKTIADARRAYHRAYKDMDKNKPTHITARIVCPVLYILNPYAFPLINSWVEDGFYELLGVQVKDLRTFDGYYSIMNPVSSVCKLHVLPNHFGALDRTISFIKGDISTDVIVKFDEAYAAFNSAVLEDPFASYEKEYPELPEDWQDMAHSLHKHGIAKYFDIDEVQSLWPDETFWEELASTDDKHTYFDAVRDALNSRGATSSVSILSQCAYLCRKRGCVPLQSGTLEFLFEKAKAIDKPWLDSEYAIEGVPTQSLAHLNALWLATAISHNFEISYGRMAQFCDWWKRQEGTVYVEESSEDELATLAEEITDPEWFLEGSKRTITVNAYERDENARRACIKHWGTICCVCGFDFVATYGDVGVGFIHVHHLKPLAEVGEQYKIDPIEDLRPVCPNCHAMIHRHQPAYTPDQVRAMIKS